MTIENEISRLQQAKGDMKTAITNRGILVTDSDKLDIYASKINQISIGKEEAAAVQANLDSHVANKTNPHGVTATQVGAVPTSRTINGKVLSGDITLMAADIGAAKAVTDSGGFAAGTNAVAGLGAAIGKNANSPTGGGAIGVNSFATMGGAVGNGAKTNIGGAVGAMAISGSGFAGGKAAKAIDSEGNGIDAIQLGMGVNSTEQTFQVYDYQLLNENGKIPTERLPDTLLNEIQVLKTRMKSLEAK